MSVFATKPAERLERPLPRSHCTTPAPISVTEVFLAPCSPDVATGLAGEPVPSVSYERPRSNSFTSAARGLISVATRDGEERYFPVVQGRAGGSLSPQLCFGESVSGEGTRSSVASRAQRHTSIISASHSSRTALKGLVGGCDAEEGETADDALATYRHSRLTPSSIQRYRRQSETTTGRCAPPVMAQRSEPIEDVARGCPSEELTPFSSLLSTPRHSVQRPTTSNFRTARSNSLAAETCLSGSSHLDRPMQVSGAAFPVRVEEMGVSSTEMAEYFADHAGLATQRRPSTYLHSRNSSAMWLDRHAGEKEVSSSEKRPRGADEEGKRSSQPLLERIMQLLEDQSRSMQDLQQRMSSLESASKNILERVETIESTICASGGGAVTRLSAAESASPSVARTSDSLSSSARPGTRAPSKAVR